MANKENGSKTPGTSRRKSSSTKKPAKQPIPINTAASSTQSGSASANPSTTPATRAYPGIEEEIRLRAYELYEQRGRQEGFHEEDWARAETEILAKYQRERSA